MNMEDRESRRGARLWRAAGHCAERKAVLERRPDTAGAEGRDARSSWG